MSVNESGRDSNIMDDFRYISGFLIWQYGTISSYAYIPVQKKFCRIFNLVVGWSISETTLFKYLVINTMRIYYSELTHVVNSTQTQKAATARRHMTLGSTQVTLNRKWVR